MSTQTISTFQSVGTSQDLVCNAAGGAPKRVFAGVTQTRRQGILLTNHDAASDILYKLVPANTSAPTISATSNNGKVEAGGKEKFIAADLGVDVYVISADSGTPAMTALPLI